MTKFQIGDTVYFASHRQKQIWIQCPECCGSGRLQVVLGNGLTVYIACICCDRGYEGSPGKIQTYAFTAEVEPMIVRGMEVEQGHPTRYKFLNQSTVEESRLFATREEADLCAVILAGGYEAEEKKRLRCKEKDTKTWAWNVAYYRRLIRDAQKTIERYTEKLNAAPKKSEE